MQDFDEFVLSLADEDRNTMIKSLNNAADRADKAAHSGSKDKRGEARRRSERFGRILYFLHNRSHSDSATVDDIELCKILSSKLQYKGQW
jgi:hypothetical protein